MRATREIIPPMDVTDLHGNTGDGTNDNGDNIAPKSISLGRYAEDRATTDEHG